MRWDPIASFFFNKAASPEIYTLSLHDALPISGAIVAIGLGSLVVKGLNLGIDFKGGTQRSEEHTSELQSHVNLVCRLLLEKKRSAQPRAQRRGPALVS